jgi:Ca-activated chloride channel family protein
MQEEISMNRHIISSILLFLVTVGIVYADGFIIIPSPPKEISFIPLSIKYHHVEVNINNQVAVTKVDQVFLNENNRELEGIYIFPIPEGASISDFAMYVDGKRVSSEVLERDKARNIYEDIVRRMKDPALLEYMDRGAFKASIYPIPARGEKRIQLEYSEVLKYDSGMCKYVYPLNTEKFSVKPIKSVTVSVQVKSDKAIKSIYSPSHDAEISRKDDHNVNLGYEASNVKPDRDFVMYYNLSDKDFGMSLLTHSDGKDDGFFILLVAPKYDIEEREVIEKDIIFILDRSGSMKENDKIEQAKGALRFCVNSLNKGDQFGIIVFSTDVDELDSSLLKATKENKEKALSFIEDIDAKGGTDINDALQTALKKKPDPERPRIIVFLTDGLPTVGEKDEKTIISNAKKTKSGSLRIFTFGVGYDVNTHFLDTLAQDNNGVPQYVEPSEDIEVSVSSFYSKINDPVLSDLKLDMGLVKVNDVYPKTLPDIFKGSQLVVMGRYKSPTKTSIKLIGKIRSRQNEYIEEFGFPGKNSDNSFIPRLWAQRKVGYLLDEIRSNGENKELKDEIIHLSKRYGIITPYTSFLVLPDTEVEGRSGVAQDQIRRESFDRSSMGLKMSKGKDAVAASKTMSEMKMIQSAPEAPTIPAEARSKPGAYPEGAAVKYVDNKTFFYKNGFWTDSEYEPEMKTIQISYGSEEYFSLLTQKAGIGKYLALGKKVILCYEGKCYKVEG